MDGQRKDRSIVMKTIAERGVACNFPSCLRAPPSRAEVVCTFLALLELIRLKQLVCIQPEPFAEIEIAGQLPKCRPRRMEPEPSAELPNPRLKTEALVRQRWRLESEHLIVDEVSKSRALENAQLTRMARRDKLRLLESS